MNRPGVAQRGIGLVLALAVVAVAATGGWRLNRPYPGEPEIWAAALPPGAVVVDARGPLAFAGGHLPSAVRLWSRDLLSYSGPVPQVLADVGTLAERLSAAGLSPDDPVVVYDDGDGADAPLVAMVLTAFGIDARVLAGGAEGWVAEGGILERGGAPAPSAGAETWAFDNRLLVRTEEIAAHVAQNLVAPVDVRPPSAYAESHLTRAVNLSESSLMPGGSLPRWSEMAGRMAAARLTDDTHVLLYGADLAQTARAWLAFRAFGRDHLHVVAGPFVLLEAAGLELTSTPVARAESKRTSSVCWGAAAALAE